jgi:hypothetical protein
MQANPVTLRLFAVDLAERRAVRVGELKRDPAARLGDISAGDSPLARNSLPAVRLSQVEKELVQIAHALSMAA